MEPEKHEPTSGRCRQCGVPLTTSDTAGLCPACQPQHRPEVDSGDPATNLRTVVAPIASRDKPSAESVGSIAGHQLLEEIGQGGMGLVYLAQQTEPVRRQVAVKVIKLGMDTRQVVARFEAERQALAVMDHPNIAKVFEAGATDSGRPYFVMELVRGIRITDYCDRHKLSTRDRLELFLPICRAVQHAHQKGIIHRDLKPSNILVTEQDGKPVPKVIDFGIAKATGETLTDRTAFTALSGAIGTPAYMSPEQAEGGLDIDTRSDIYSLGVLLYELLTGRTPFETEELIKVGLEAMRQKLREEEPPRPSTRLTSLANNELTDIARHRQTEPLRLVRLVRGDLDWIVMKALDKERSRRYETANGLAMDIQRHLQNEPVLASPPGMPYRASKFVRRHKGPVLAGSFVLAALVAGIVSTTWGLFRAERARAAVARQKAIAEAAQRFLEQDLLEQADPTEQADTIKQIGGGFKIEENPRIKTLLDRAALMLAPDKIESKFPGQPEVQASVLETVGKTYRAVGDYEKSTDFLRRASDLYKTLPEGKASNAMNVLNTLVLTYLDAGKAAQAVTLAEEVRDARLKQLGRGHLDTLAALNNLGMAYMDAGKAAQAAQLFEEVFQERTRKLGPNHRDTLNTLNNLALSYNESGKIPPATALFEQGREASTRALGPDHPLTLRILHNLASAYQAAGKKAQAIEVLVQCRDAQASTLGPEHPESLLTLENLATLYKETRRFPEAISMFEQLREGRIKRFGPEHPFTIQAMHNLAAALRTAGRVPEAITLYEQVRELRIRVLGPEHVDTLTTLNNLAVAYQDAGRLLEAIALFENVLDVCNRKLGPGHSNTLGTMENLGRAHRLAHNPGEALKLFRTAMERYESSAEPRGPTDSAYNGLGDCLEDLHQYEEAETWRRKCVEAAEKKSGPDSLPYASAKAQLGLNLLMQQKWATAESALRESLAIREKNQPEVWTTFNSRAMLGGALLGQKRFADAEPFLTSGYTGMKEREGTIPPLSKIRLNQTLEWILQLYQDWDKAAPGSDKLEKAVPWQRQRASGSPSG